MAVVVTTLKETLDDKTNNVACVCWSEDEF